MDLSFVFFLNSTLLGAGLAMDAFSVSMANGLNEPEMKNARILSIAAVFGVFQAIMPLLGWICVHTVVVYFAMFETFIPWIALALLGFIGGKMLIEGLQNKETGASKTALGISALLIQGLATSIDALSAGFTIANYDQLTALTAAVIIAVITFLICICGLIIGKRFGTKLKNKASILGGAILIGIGIEIFISGIQ